MRKLFFALVSVGLLLIANSCITVEETYTFKKNGSGSMTYKIDMGKMMEQMAGLMDMSQMDGGNPLGNSANFDQFVPKLKALKGISGVKATQDNKKYIYAVSFKFKNIDALNDAMNVLTLDKQRGDSEYFTFFKKNGKQIEYKTTQTTGVMQDINGMFGEGEDSEMADQLGSAMEGIKHVLTINLPAEAGAVYAGSDKKENVVMNGKQVQITSSFKDLKEKGDALLNTTVIYK